jgi:hypothetical protein
LKLINLKKKKKELKLNMSNENLPVSVITNKTSVYLEDMRSRFATYHIENEDEFCEALMDIVNQYSESEFSGQIDKMQAFLYFHDVDMLLNAIYNRIGVQRVSLFSLVYENLIVLLQAYYTYEDYLADLV